MPKKKRKKSILVIVLWILLALSAITLYFVASGFIIFPDKYQLPLAIILGVIVFIMAYFLFRKKGGPKHAAASVICLALAFCMVLASLYLVRIEGKVRNLFANNSESSVVRINAYVLTSDYKSAHADLFDSTETSENLSDYIDSVFITQDSIDQENQEYALEDIKSQLGADSLNTVTKDGIISAVQALYDHEGDVLVMNENFESTLTELAQYANFSTDVKILYTVERKIDKTDEEIVDLSKGTPFLIYLFGEDTRSGYLSTYGRTDVDMLMTVNPNTHQILQVSIPRDYYIYNPALGGLDKLTHLGNNDVSNTVEGLNQEFSLDSPYYVVVNFLSFYNIINAIGGIDIYNPYAFSTSGSNGSAVWSGKSYIGGDYYFEEGDIHLDGDMAISYVRERYNLPNGDYSRNEHQSIVIEGIIKKLTSPDILNHINDVLDALQGQFLTNFPMENIYQIAEDQLSDGSDWTMIRYHLGGTGTYKGTVSMGWNRMLYVVIPFDSQVQFVHDQVTAVLNGETITQETLPDNDETTYISN